MTERSIYTRVQEQIDAFDALLSGLARALDVLESLGEDDAQVVSTGDRLRYQRTQREASAHRYQLSRLPRAPHADKPRLRLKWEPVTKTRDANDAPTWLRAIVAPGLVADVQMFPDMFWHAIINRYELDGSTGFTSTYEACMAAERELWSRVEAALKAFGK